MSSYEIIGIVGIIVTLILFVIGLKMMSNVDVEQKHNHK